MLGIVRGQGKVSVKVAIVGTVIRFSSVSASSADI